MEIQTLHRIPNAIFAVADLNYTPLNELSQKSTAAGTHPFRKPFGILRVTVQTTKLAVT